MQPGECSSAEASNIFLVEASYIHATRTYQHKILNVHDTLFTHARMQAYASQDSETHSWRSFLGRNRTHDDIRQMEPSWDAANGAANQTLRYQGTSYDTLRASTRHRHGTDVAARDVSTRALDRDDLRGDTLHAWRQTRHAYRIHQRSRDSAFLCALKARGLESALAEHSKQVLQGMKKTRQQVSRGRSKFALLSWL